MAQGPLSIKFTGIEDLKKLMNEMQADFGPKDQKNILKTAARKSMEPVLMTAKSLVAKDTGALAASLRIEARPPNTKDKKSVYVHNTDTVIGTVTTAPGNVLAKRKFHNLHNTKSKIKQVGIKSDARAIANEFGTAKMAAKPFMRPAFQANADLIVSTLATSIRFVLEKYRSKNQK
jgi:HK97 gp10 family phage protein